MGLAKHIPNLLTLGNLACGFACIVFALNGNLRLAGGFILIAAVFDFLDGFAARMLKVQSELGKPIRFPCRYGKFWGSACHDCHEYDDHASGIYDRSKPD